MLTRDQILAVADTPLKPEKVVTPLGEVYVPRLNAVQWTAFLDRCKGKRKGVELANVIVDQYGTPLFGEADAERLERLPVAFTIPVTAAFNEVNNLVPKDSATGGDAPSASPPTSAGPTPTPSSPA